MKLRHQLLAEFFGSAALLVVIVGSGIMGEELSHGNSAIALLANSIATGAGLYALIQTLAPVSGAHFNPAVTFAKWLRKSTTTKELIGYSFSQILGAIFGVLITHVMFGKDIFQISIHDRGAFHFLFSEFIATFGLITVIFFTTAKNCSATPSAVALYITSAYWCTSSTSFANPAVTIARSLTNTFSGILWTSMPWFIAAQIIGTLGSVWFSTIIYENNQ